MDWMWGERGREAVVSRVAGTGACRFSTGTTPRKAVRALPSRTGQIGLICIQPHRSPLWAADRNLYNPSMPLGGAGPAFSVRSGGLFEVLDCFQDSLVTASGLGLGPWPLILLGKMPGLWQLLRNSWYNIISVIM